MTTSLQELRARYKNLPEDVQDAINSINVEEVLEEIRKKFSLHLDQAGELADETYSLMHGITAPEQFVGNIAKRCRISKDTAKELAEEVNKRIFYPIRGSLMKIHRMIENEENDDENGGEEESVEKTAPPASVNIAEEKLKGSFNIPKKTSGYAGSDPYREAAI